MKLNIGIAGAGIIGRLLACTLVQQGHKVTLFDKTHADDQRTTSHVAAGMLSPYAELEYGDAKLLTLAQDALTRWAEIFTVLNLNTTDVLQSRGSLMLAKPQDKGEVLQFIRRTHKIGLDCTLLSHDELVTLEPAFTDQTLVGVYLPQEAHIDVSKMLGLLSDYSRKHGVIWHENTLVSQITQDQIQTLDQHFIFDRVFDCRGMGAAVPGIRAVRGELIHLHAPDVKITRPIRLLHPRYHLYLVPKQGEQYIIGATSIESEDYSPISLQSALELLSACYVLHPGFAEARIIHTATQCRPAFADHMPRVIKTDDCIHINGMYRHGYLLAPLMVASALSYL